MILTGIAAVSQNGIIGHDNNLIWHLPDDLKHFKNLTKGHAIIMGRKTWESLGSRPLPHRTHIIISRNPNFKAEGATVVHTLEAAMALAKADPQPFIIGGGAIFSLAMPITQRLELTIVHHDFEGDIKFPEYDASLWEETASVYHPADDRHAYAFTFKTLERIK